MKNLLAILALAFITTSCKKQPGDNPSPQEKKSYQNMASGSQWLYHQTDLSSGASVERDYTLTSTDRDTTINNKKYHVFAHSADNSRYLNKTSNDYYEYSNFADLGQTVEQLYLKTNVQVNTSWTQEMNVPVPNFPVSIKVKATQQIADIAERTVNGVLYPEAIHVKTTLSSPDIPSDKFTSNIHSYYAPEVGMIENTTQITINYFGMDMNVNVKTTLTSSSLK